VKPSMFSKKILHVEAKVYANVLYCMKQGSVFFVSGRISGSPETDLNVSLSNILKTPA
jgi:hypothetical protein